MTFQHSFIVATSGRGLEDITAKVAEVVMQAGIQTGLCHLFLHHTSASLTIGENYDSLVLRDMEAFMQRLIPDGDPLFQHIEEGPDDMPSHIRTILTQSFLMIPITDSKLALGRWQGIYLWEHRFKKYDRKLTITIL